jgi:predicted metallopeptidase
MFIDSNIFFNLSEEDKVRIIRHELRHIFYDSEATVPYKTIDHDVTDFMVEIELNHDDLKWNQRVSEIAQSVYSKE